MKSVHLIIGLIIYFVLSSFSLAFSVDNNGFLSEIKGLYPNEGGILNKTNVPYLLIR
jgi:hypothetical protein